MKTSSCLSTCLWRADALCASPLTATRSNKLLKIVHSSLGKGKKKSRKKGEINLFEMKARSRTHLAQCQFEDPGWPGFLQEGLRPRTVAEKVRGCTLAVAPALPSQAVKIVSMKMKCVERHAELFSPEEEREKKCSLMPRNKIKGSISFAKKATEENLGVRQTDVTLLNHTSS